MSTLRDVIGEQHIESGVGYSFTLDRFNNPNSAIYLNDGYLQLKPTIHFSGDFTIIAWIKMFKLDEILTVFKSDYIWFYIGKRLKLKAKILNESKKNALSSDVELKLNKWYHVAYVLEGLTGHIYLNGVEIATESQNVLPISINKSTSYIGGNNNGSTYACVDDVKIYKGSLKPIEVMEDYFDDLPGKYY